MQNSEDQKPKTPGVGQLVYILMAVAILVLWVVVTIFSVSERKYDLRQATEQLQDTVITLADFNELALADNDPLSGPGSSDTRTEALWRALLQYPTASIWMEVDGLVTDGLPAEDLADNIVVREDRAQFSILAALPEGEALTDWYRTMWFGSALLFALTIAFSVLTHYLVKAIRLRTEAEAKIEALARIDVLTGLANRAVFNDRLHQAFSIAQRGGNSFALFYMDLDHFKNINDTLGHPVGDELLIAVGGRLRESTREGDVLARLGGDEFAILQLDMGEPANAVSLAKNIQKLMSKPFTLAGNQLHITTSIGICPYSDDTESPDQMLSQADLALYRSKEDGRNRYRFHSPDLDQHVHERTEMAEELHKAIDNNEVALRYQPQVSIIDGQITGMKALVCWNHSTRGFLKAEEFIQVAEKTGNMVALGHWILNQACRQLAEWRQQGVTLEMISLNLSGIQLKDSQNLLRDIRETTAKWGIAPQDLELDLTEAMLALTTQTQNDVVKQLNESGCRIAIDNFGMDYSIINSIRFYGVKQLKIDRLLINRALSDPEWEQTLCAIAALAKEINIALVAEGIETAAERRKLRYLVDRFFASVYYYAQPVDQLQVLELLRVGRIEHHDG